VILPSISTIWLLYTRRRGMSFRDDVKFIDGILIYNIQPRTQALFPEEET
jgi:hypothetical protein